MNKTPPFHLAFLVTDLEEARKFYADLLGCPTGRESERWIDFDFYGHQLVAHLASSEPAIATNPVDGKQVPVPHFGVIVEWHEWHRLADRLKAAGIHFLIEPGIRFQGQAGEQATMFFKDPSGNALEFKTFRDPAQIFARG
ncbi:MAG: VOC family protein [Gammaproteobacteria bacterium]|nr:VOC family protein [Gammaproteobacteria bacterium]MDE2345053.1 VOC family protein [Gammaproteobacteria bacterium]